jgi:hypothetical protein
VKVIYAWQLHAKPFACPTVHLEVVWKGKTESEQVFVQHGNANFQTFLHTCCVHFAKKIVGQEQPTVDFGHVRGKPF